MIVLSSSSKTVASEVPAPTRFQLPTPRDQVAVQAAGGESSESSWLPRIRARGSGDRARFQLPRGGFSSQTCGKGEALAPDHEVSAPKTVDNERFWLPEARFKLPGRWTTRGFSSRRRGFSSQNRRFQLPPLPESPAGRGFSSHAQRFQLPRLWIVRGFSSHRPPEIALAGFPMPATRRFQLPPLWTTGGSSSHLGLWLPNRFARL